MSAASSTITLTILGGGGFRVPLVHAALLRDTLPGRVTHLRLHDNDQQRLDAVAAVLAEQRDGVRGAPEVSLHTNLDEALRGADVVFSAIRVGGLAGRALDERLPLKHHLLGQETVGVGGISYGLRTLPVVTHIAERIKAVAPQAWVINFTNPAGVVTEALAPILGERVVGICDSPVGLARRAMLAAGVSADDRAGVEVDYCGLNHLGWVTGLRLGERDLLTPLLADEAALTSFEEGRLFGAEWLATLGALPNEYLHHYYFAREDLAQALTQSQTRAEQILDQQQDFFGVDPSTPGAFERWERTRMARELTYMQLNRDAAGSFDREESDLTGGGYEEVALAIMHAIIHDRPATLILNRPNQGRLATLDDDAVIEAPCLVDAAGFHPLPTALPDHGVGLVQQVKYVERRTLAAAASGSRAEAWRALAAHPLVDSVTVARQLLDELVSAHAELAYLR